MKNLIFKTLFLCGAMLLFNCESDNQSQTEINTENQQNFVLKKLNLKELRKNTKAFEKLKEAEAQTTVHLAGTINNIKALSQSDILYNIKTSNCADFAITVFNASTNITIPSCESPKSYWSGQTPATLGEVIRTMPLPSGTTRNITGGTAPLNNAD